MFKLSKITLVDLDMSQLRLEYVLFKFFPRIANWVLLGVIPSESKRTVSFDKPFESLLSIIVEIYKSKFLFAYNY